MKHHRLPWDSTLAVALFAAALGVLASVPLPLEAAASSSPPNIIVVVTDDHGWADLGRQGNRDDLRTPHLDSLVADGVRFTRGYVSAPVCVPSRAGLLTGRSSTRFGMEVNDDGPLPAQEETIGDLLKRAGYVTGLVGKWHVAGSRAHNASAKPNGSRDLLWGDNAPVTDKNLPAARGFDDYFCGASQNYAVSFDLQGNSVPNPPVLRKEPGFRVDVQTEAALAFINRQSNRPFFLYLGYFAPHVPLEAPEKYLSRFPHVSEPIRRAGLAMIAAVDDGLGRIRQRLRERGWDQNTLIFFLADNGAPTKPGMWNGSLNDPLSGEKGLLMDGGIRVPFVASWPGILPAGKTFESPVTSLDILPTALGAARAAVKPANPLDGVNLLPFLTGAQSGSPHDALFWRFRSQAAVLSGNWKLVLVAPDQWLLFNLQTPEGELRSLADQHPEIVSRLRRQLQAWAAAQSPPGLPTNSFPEDLAYLKRHAPWQPANTAPVPNLRLVGDWELSVTLPGDAPSTHLKIAPPPWITVNNERVDQLEQWSDQPGWARKKIPGLADGLCSARFVLDGSSLVVRSTPDPRGVTYETGKDFKADIEWGGIGRIAGGRIGSNQPVYLSYRFQQRRLDSVVLSSTGEIFLRAGRPHIATPLPPDLRAGETRLANIWLPENLKKLGPDNLFPILETAFPESPTPIPAPAEKLLPETTRRLRTGEPLKILAWGDSVTQGYLGKDQWQNQFVRRLEARFPQAKIELVTVGWGAHNSADFLNAPPGHIRNYAESVLAVKPHLIVSEFVNDAALDAQLVQTNYVRFLQDFRRLGAEWIILTPHYNTFMGLPRERDIDDDPRPYVQMLRRFSLANQVALADAAVRYGRLWRQGLPWSTLMVNTANHPDARGMAIFADSLMALFP